LQRYLAYVANEPFQNPERLDEDFKQRLMYLAGWQMSHKLLAVVDDYFEAARQDYQFAVKRAIVEEAFFHGPPTKRAKLEEMRVQPEDNVRPLPL
jgi:hypothetical protein